MRTDYKFWYITRDDNGFIEKVAIRFYEGDFKDVTITDSITEESSVKNMYVREKHLQAKDLAHLGTGFEKDANGNDCKIYTSADFGEIKTDDELRAFLNGEIQKDGTREAVDVQKVTDLNTLKSMDIK